MNTKPVAPLNRFLKESDVGPYCPDCGSSFKTVWFIRQSGCIQPECSNAYPIRDLEAETDLRDMQEAVFAGDVEVERFTDSVEDYIGTRDSKLYINTSARRTIIYWACGIYVAVIAYGAFHHLLPWHVS